MSSQPTYPPRPYRETRREAILGFIRAMGFGHIISAAGDGAPHATGAPFLVRDEGGELVLECHLQRGNPQWRAIEAAPEAGVMVLFQGPNAYVHPGWYETKKQDGRAVPTWNYITVQARGVARVVEGDEAWLRRHLAALTSAHEAGRDEPWAMDDAPADYIDTLVKGIVGVSLTVHDLDGRWKMNQNHPEANRRGVIDGLLKAGDPGADEIAQAMMRREAGETV